MQITQKNLYNLIPPKAARIAAMLQKDHHMEPKQALLAFYSSQAYKLLEREETKLWHSSPEQIYAEYLTSCKKPNRSYQNGPGHSKLAPYSDQIKLWHKKGMTLRAIAAELQKYGCHTTPQNLSLFLKKHAGIF